MKAAYKNKRDQYKAERDGFEREINRLKRELLAVEKPPAKKRAFYDATVFCEHCLAVKQCGMPEGVEVRRVKCPVCRVAGYLRYARYMP